MSPREVVLLLGVPVTETGFRSAWEMGSDYLRDLRAVYPDCTAGWSAYSAAAQLAIALCRDCRELGATVVFDATLSALAEHAARFPVVVLMTHMAFPTVEKADLRDSRALFERVQTGEEIEWELLRSVLPQEADTDDLLDAINRLLTDTHRQLSAYPVEDPRDAQAAARQRHTGYGLLRFDRPRLDELCSADILAPGLGIELSTGMITAQEFVSAFPLNFDGLLDLRMCNSISAGAALRRARPQARVAVSKRQVRMDASLCLIKATLQCMVQRGANRYSDQAPLSYEDSMRLVMEAVR
jgi:hypothetical protein